MKRTLLLFLSAVVFGQDAEPSINDFLANFKEATGRVRTDASVAEATDSVADRSEVNPRFSYPFLGFIRIDGQPDSEYFCSGTLLDSKTLLTAAHCVSEANAGQFKAFFHRHNRNHTTKSERGSEHRFSKVYAHEKYELKNGVPLNDIALVRLATAVQHVGKPVYVILPQTKDNPNTEIELTIVGWGLTKSGDEPTDHLQDAEKLHLTNTCFKKGSGLIRTQHLCAINAGDAEPCSDDSGGPLLVPDNEGYIQVGIVPAQPKCAAGKKSGLYTRVFAHTSWISDTLKKLS